MNFINVKDIWNNLVYSNFLWASACMSLSCFTMLFLNMNIDWKVLAITFCQVIIVYNIDRLLDLKNQPPTDTTGKSFYSNKKTLIKLANYFAVLVTIILMFSLKLKSILILLTCMCVGILYGIPFITIGANSSKQPIRIKDIPYSKALIVTVTLVLDLIGLPIANTNLSISLNETIVICLFYFTHLLSNVIAGDLRDIESDKLYKVQTIPVLLGYRNTKILLISINLFIAITLIMFKYEVTFFQLIPIMVTLCANSIALLFFNQKTEAENYNHLDLLHFLPIIIVLLLDSVNLPILRSR